MNRTEPKAAEMNNRTPVKQKAMPEILAPVGSQDALIAAVRSGADAVYFGTGECNARRSAGKFEGTDLIDAVNYCHARNVKVYLTMNTLLWDSELNSAKNTIEAIAKSGADAIIIQDLAVAKMAKEICPSLGRHASTQMAVHNIRGVSELAEHGFSRIVLARELSEKEIFSIRQATDAEIEVFIHGALCMSASGMCYLSSSLGERSGNRGTCAQPCRLPFTCGESEYCLSLKDMSYLKYLKNLSDTGINSLKIEGRMKRAEYVAASVDAARKALAGDTYRTEELRSVFSRSGFTDGYYTGNRDRNMFGTRTQEDAEKTKESASAFKDLYRKERTSVPFSASVSAHAGIPLTLTVSDGINTITSIGNIPQKADHSASTEENVLRSIGKTGGTTFFLSDSAIDLEEGLMIPPSEMNRLRKEALELLLTKRESVNPHPIRPYSIPSFRAGKDREESFYRCRFLKAEQVFSNKMMSAYSLPVSELIAHPDLITEKTQCEIPELVYPLEEEKLLDKLFQLKEKGLKSAVVNSYGAIRLAREAGLEIHGGYGLNVTNSMAAHELKQFGIKDLVLSFEMPYSKMNVLSAPFPVGCIIAGKLPLMQMRSCPARKTNGCGDCKGSPVIKDRTNRLFRLVCHEKKYSTLLNSVMYYTADKTLPKVDYYSLYFSLETKEEAQALFESAISGSRYDGERTTGASFRVLQ